MDKYSKTIGRDLKNNFQQIPCTKVENVANLYPIFSIQIEQKSSTHNSEGYAEKLAKEVVFGGFYKGDSTFVGITGNILIGFIPIFGQVADVRDVIAATIAISEDPKSFKNWADLGLSTIGLIPGGDIAKVINVKGSKTLIKAGVQQVGKPSTKKLSVEFFFKGVLAVIHTESKALRKIVGRDLTSNVVSKMKENFPFFPKKKAFIYRAVSPDEFYDIIKHQKFRPGSNSLENVKQFGVSFDETLKYASLPMNWEYAAFMRAEIPQKYLKEFLSTTIDSSIFRQGVINVPTDRLFILSNPFHEF